MGLAQAQALQARFGIDASVVRIHDDAPAQAAASALSAAAFTYGNDIYLAAPQPSGGVEGTLLQHEVGHVAQHQRGEVAPGPPSGRGDAIEHTPRGPAPVTDPNAAPRRVLRRVVRVEGEPRFHVEAPLRHVEWGQAHTDVIPFDLPIDETTADWISGWPGFDAVFIGLLQEACTPGGLPCRESAGFLAGPAISIRLARDLGRSARANALSLGTTQAFLAARDRALRVGAVVPLLDTWLVAEGHAAGPVLWEHVLSELQAWSPTDTNTGLDASDLARYDLLLDRIRLEVEGRALPMGGDVPAVVELGEALYTWLGSDTAPDLGEDVRSEAFLDVWLDRLIELAFAPEGFDPETYFPSPDEDAIERERDEIIARFLSAAPPAGTFTGEGTMAGDLMVRHLLDRWTLSGLTPDAFLAEVDLEALRPGIIDAVVDGFVDLLKTDPDFRAAMLDYGIQKSRADMLRLMFLSATASEDHHIDLAVRLLDSDLGELDEDELAIAADPAEYVLAQEQLASATYDFFTDIQIGTSLEDATVSLVEALGELYELPTRRPCYALLLQILLGAAAVKKSFDTQVEAARERIRDALDLEYDRIAAVIRQAFEFADRWVREVWIPTLKAVAIERLTANRDEIQVQLDGWEEQVPLLILRYELAALALEDQAEEVAAGRELELDGEASRATKKNLDNLRTGAKMMRAQANALRDPEQAADKRAKLEEAVAGFDEVIEGVQNEDPYKPWALGPEIADEARIRVGIEPISGPFTYRDVLSRDVVARTNPFLEYATYRWQFFEELDARMASITTFLALGLLTVASLAVPGVGGAILAAVDVGYGVYTAYKGVKDAYALRRMARLDVDLSVYGITEEQADAAIHDAWVGAVLTGVLTAGIGVLGGLRAFAKGKQVVRRFRYPHLTRLEAGDPAALAQLLTMAKDLRKLEKLLDQTAGDAHLLRQLLQHGTADEIAGLLTHASDARALHTVLGWADDLDDARALLSHTADTAALARVLDGMGDLTRVRKLLTELDPVRLDAMLARIDGAQLAKLTDELGTLRTEKLLVGPDALADDGVAALLRADADAMRMFNRVDDASLRVLVQLDDDTVRLLSTMDDTARGVSLRLDVDVIPFLRRAETAERLDLLRLADADPAGVSSLLRTYGDDALGYLRFNPSPNLTAVADGLKAASKRVRDPVPGLYDSIPVGTPGGDAVPAAGWSITTSRKVVAGGKTKWSSIILAPDGSRLSIGRFWQPSTGTMTMDTAFGSPNIAQVPTTPALVASKGTTPAMTYVSLHQMRMIGIPSGVGATTSPLKTVKMSTIQNFETISHLHWLRARHPGMSADDLIRHTASYQYAETILTQAGYRIRGAKVDFASNGSIPVDQLLAHYETDDMADVLFGQTGAARATVHDAIFARYGFDRTTPMRTNFDIYLTVGPIP